ncbi:MAG: hypothetical protein R2737_07770 [Candidatus Nanopelagicales bacterium]
MTRTGRRPAALVTAALVTTALLLAACGGGSDPAGGNAADGGGAAAAAQDAGSTGDGGADAVCAAVESVDLSAAFGGTLTFGAPQDVTGTGRGCVAAVEGSEGEGLIATVTTGDYYREKAKYEKQDVPFEWIDGLGEEAFLVNEADLNVLLADDSAVNVAISAFFTSGSPPDPAVLRAGLVTVADAVVAAQ